MDGGSRILIVGGGCGGMHTALRLERLLGPGEATVMVAGPRSYMTYQPLLAEAAREVVSLDALKDPAAGLPAAVRVIATGPSRVTPIPNREEEEAEHHAYHR